MLTVKVGQGLYARADPSIVSGEPIPVGGLNALKEALRRVGVETLPSRLGRDYTAGRGSQSREESVVHMSDALQEER